MAIIGLASLLFPSTFSQSAAGEPIHLTHRDARVTGAVACELTNFAAFLMPPVDGTARHFAWRLEAETLTVHWTQRKYLVRGSAPDLSSPGGEYALGPPAEGAETFADGSANSFSRSNRSHILGLANDAASLKVTLSEGSLILAPTHDTQWLAGSAATPSGDAATTHVAEVPEKLAQLNLDTGEVALEGNFSLVLWDQNVTVQTGSGNRSFESGAWVSKEPLGGPTGAWEVTKQKLELKVTNGRLRIDTHAWPFQAAFEQIEITGIMKLRLNGAEGHVPLGHTTKQVENESLVFEGKGTLRTRNATTSSPRLLSELRLEGGTVEVMETVRLPSEGAYETGGESHPFHKISTWGLAWLWWPVAGLAVLLAVGAINRIEPFWPDLTDVEWAILDGHWRRATRWARRLARRNPADPDALFLYGSMLLKAKRFADIVDELEPPTLAIAPKLRSGIAYLLAIAGRHLGDMPRAFRWAREAAREPALRIRLLQDPWFERAIARPRAASDQAYA